MSESKREKSKPRSRASTTRGWHSNSSKAPNSSRSRSIARSSYKKQMSKSSLQGKSSRLSRLSSRSLRSSRSSRSRKSGSGSIEGENATVQNILKSTLDRRAELLSSAKKKRRSVYEETKLILNKQHLRKEAHSFCDDFKTRLLDMPELRGFARNLRDQFAYEGKTVFPFTNKDIDDMTRVELCKQLSIHFPFLKLDNSKLVIPYDWRNLIDVERLPQFMISPVNTMEVLEDPYTVMAEPSLVDTQFSTLNKGDVRGAFRLHNEESEVFLDPITEMKYKGAYTAPDIQMRHAVDHWFRENIGATGDDMRRAKKIDVLTFFAGSSERPGKIPLIYISKTASIREFFQQFWMKFDDLNDTPSDDAMRKQYNAITNLKTVWKSTNEDTPLYKTFVEDVNEHAVTGKVVLIHRFEVPIKLNLQGEMRLTSIRGPVERYMRKHTPRIHIHSFGTLLAHTAIDVLRSPILLKYSDNMIMVGSFSKTRMIYSKYTTGLQHFISALRLEPSDTVVNFQIKRRPDGSPIVTNYLVAISNKGRDPINLVKLADLDEELAFLDHKTLFSHILPALDRLRDTIDKDADLFVDLNGYLDFPVSIKDVGLLDKTMDDCSYDGIIYITIDKIPSRLFPVWESIGSDNRFIGHFFIKLPSEIYIRDSIRRLTTNVRSAPEFRVVKGIDFKVYNGNSDRVLHPLQSTGIKYYLPPDVKKFIDIGYDKYNWHSSQHNYGQNIPQADVGLLIRPPTSSIDELSVDDLRYVLIRHTSLSVIISIAIDKQTWYTAKELLNIFLDQLNLTTAALPAEVVEFHFSLVDDYKEVMEWKRYPMKVDHREEDDETIVKDTLIQLRSDSWEIQHPTSTDATTNSRGDFVLERLMITFH